MCTFFGVCHACMNLRWFHINKIYHLDSYPIQINIIISLWYRHGTVDEMVVFRRDGVIGLFCTFCTKW